MVFLVWLSNHMLDNGLEFPKDFVYSIHSQNPIGAKNIEMFIENFMAILKGDES